MKKLLTSRRYFIAVISFLFFSHLSFSQNNFRVSGTIRDNNGQPVEGVSVQEKGTQNTTTTTKDGSFSLRTASGNATLVLSSIGYERQEIAISNQANISVSLETAANSMNEVVVIGYGTQKKRNVTGAVSKLKNENFDERPLIRVDQALVGQLSGVTVKQNTGIPGKGFSVQVRGSGSISGGNEPLYVIDGFPLSVNSSNTGNGTFTTGNPLDNINPNDIESIEVLKDAAAAAIYGSRASNGVVLITTKRGRVGKPVVNLNIYAGYNQASKKLQMMNGDQWIENATEVINAQYVARYGSVGATANDDQATRLAKNGGLFDPQYILDPRWAMPGHPGLQYVDWQDAIERKGIIQNYQLSVSGGTDAVKYFMSGNFANQESFIKNVGYKTYSIRANLDITASKRIKFGVNIAPTYSETQDPGLDGQNAIFHQILSHSPVQEDTVGFFTNTGKNLIYLYSNSIMPYGRLIYAKGTTKRFRTLGTIYGELQIAKGLNFRTSVNLDNTDNIATTYVPYIIVGNGTKGINGQPDVNPRIFTGSNNLLASTSGTYNSYRRQTFVNENTVTYNTIFKKDHSVNLLAGYSYNYDHLDRVTMSSNGGYTSAVIQTLNAAAAVTGNTTSTQNVLTSFFGRMQYGYKDKYFLNASIRRDGSSRFGSNSQFGTFPSVSLKWIASDENFIKSISAISDLRLRVSYGVNGNNNLPNDYASIATIGSAGYVFGPPAAVIGQAPNVLANPDLQWERSETYDIGFDFGILRNRITGSFDYYNKLNTDLLLNVQVPSVTGFASYLTNIGSVRNIGQEYELNTRNLIGRFQWNTSFILTHNTNKIEALAPGQQQIIIPQGNNVTDQILRVGYALNSIYVLRTIGFLTQDDIIKNVARYGAEQEGDLKYQDTNGDGVISEADKVIVGHPSPDYTYGVTNTFKYKGFDLNVLVQGQWGGSVYSELGRALNRPGQGRSDNHTADYVNRWRSTTNQGDGRYGKTYSTYYSPITSATDNLFSSDYVRVRNITLGYNLKTVIKTSVIQGARIYFTLENFFGHDKYANGLNPDAVNTSSSSNSAFPAAGDYGGIPLPKALIFGLNVSF
jgi:TonB-linked SusC/RagA family outer membrane protein